MSEPIRDVETAVRELGALPVPVGDSFRLTAEQRAKIAEQLGDAKPAAPGLLVAFGESVRNRREHAHPTWEDLYCQNLSSYMGERMAPVLRRLIDAEAQVAELEAGIAWRDAERARWAGVHGLVERAIDKAWSIVDTFDLEDALGPEPAAPAKDPCHPCGCPKRFSRHADGCPSLPAAMRAEDVVDLLALAPAEQVNARHNSAARTIELELTATPKQWSAWQTALSVDLGRTTNRGSCITSHATWRGIHIVICCWPVKPESEGSAEATASDAEASE
ncbi:hypothetical protein [Streptomyces turgidiscabies]|uniref:hypothetical protein n=1 Tax=Streptomyces turgidiscabies TaxID=85558 RepID=UPI0038F7E07E